jgi:hypothetical protein
MSVKDDVFHALKNTGEKMKKDLWQPDDLKTLLLIANDLVGLNDKAQNAATPADRQKSLDAASGLLEHVKLLALSRINIATNDAFEALKTFFMTLVAGWLPKLLAHLGAAL